MPGMPRSAAASLAGLGLTAGQRRSASPVVAGAVIVGALVTAVLAGLVSTTASPVLLGLVGGSLMGGFLLMAPRLSFWLTMAGALIASGVISLFFPGLNKVTWLFSMLGFLMLFAAALHAMGSRSEPPAPAFIKLGLVFIVYAVAVAPLAGSTPFELLAGLKRYFQFWGVMLLAAWMLQVRTEGRLAVRLLFVLALLQLPMALYQRLELVPRRQGLGGGVVPIDVVSGTFEATMLGGGNSSAMVLFLTIALAFTLAAWREGVLRPLVAMLLSLWFIAPMALGETKVVVLFLPLMVLVLFWRYVRRAPVQSFLLLIVGLVLAGVLGYVYLSYFGTPGMSVEQRLQATIDYNFGRVGYYGGTGLNRTTALRYWLEHNGWSNPHEFVFGHGLGSSYAAPTSFVQGHVARLHGFIAIGLTAASSILWDLGVVGIVLYLGMLALAWRHAGRLLPLAPAGWYRAALISARVGLALFVVLLFYTDSMLNSLSVQFLLMTLLGGIAMASRTWRDAPATPESPARTGMR